MFIGFDARSSHNLFSSGRPCATTGSSLQFLSCFSGATLDCVFCPAGSMPADHIIYFHHVLSCRTFLVHWIIGLHFLSSTFDACFILITVFFCSALRNHRKFMTSLSFCFSGASLACIFCPAGSMPADHISSSHHGFFLPSLR